MMKKYRVRFWPGDENRFIEVEAKDEGHAIYQAIEMFGTENVQVERVKSTPAVVWEARIWIEEVPQEGQSS